METLDKKVTAVVKSSSKNMNKDIIKNFKKASDEFDKLVDAGLAQRRGYTLATIGDVAECSSFSCCSLELNY